jgi:hypothetical protein
VFSNCFSGAGQGKMALFYEKTLKKAFFLAKVLVL